jgi:anti-anti-sigma factor
VQDETAFPIARVGPDACLVAASGELDGSNAWRLQDALGAAGATGARRVIADFAAVTYFDADALAVLAASATHIRGTGGTLIVVTDDPWLLRLLDAGELEDVRLQRSLREVVEGLQEEMHA